VRREPPEVAELGGKRLLAPMIPPRYGGLGWTHAQLGDLCCDLGSVDSALRAAVTVQSMTAAAVVRWGSAGLRDRVLPGLSDGSLLAGFCLTEPEAGSDAASVRSQATARTGSWLLDGAKVWVTGGRWADVLLVIAATAEGPLALLVEAGGDGVRREPVEDSLAMPGAGLADIAFDRVEVPADAVVGRPGMGLSHVAGVALANGRLTVAAGCAGLARTCRDHAVAHARSRRQDSRPIGDHQLVRRLLARAGVASNSADLVYRWAAAGLDERADDAGHRAILAKYTAARAADEAADCATQVLGSAAFRAGHPVTALVADARVMRIIEGTDEICESVIGETLLRSRGDSGR